MQYNIRGNRERRRPKKFKLKFKIFQKNNYREIINPGRRRRRRRKFIIKFNPYL
jgi:hypothetical protein